jgi:hypothetical protein
MKMMANCIRDLKTMMEAYPIGSNGYDSLHLAVSILSQLEMEESAPKGAGSPHWVLGQGAGSANNGVTINVPIGTAFVEHQ